MGMRERIDVNFDFRSDTPEGKDPDGYSPTLRRYHRLLWSKPLSDGTMFDLDDTTRGEYLHHKSDKHGEFFLTSDAVVPSFRYEEMVKDEVSAEELGELNHIGYTIGGMMLWPGNQVDRKMTINGARGCHPRIKDRFDLTLECIRRHYAREKHRSREANPLGEVLDRYADFFALFGNFRGFVEYFLLQDAVTVNCGAVIFSTPFDDFTTSPIPQTLEEYREYRQRAISFIKARNRRIRSCGLAHLSKDDPSSMGVGSAT